MAKRKSRWASQAALQAFLKYNPEESGLRELQRTAQGQYETAVKQAHGTSRGIIGAIDSATPKVAQVYDEAGLRQAQTAGTIRADVAPLANVTDPIRAAAMLEVQQGGRFVNEGRASALTDLASRKVGAREGEAYAVNAARSQLVTDLTKVLQRKQDLRQEKGAYAALTTQQLRDTAQKEAQKLDIAMAQLEQSDRNSRRTANTSRTNAQLTAQQRAADRLSRERIAASKGSGGSSGLPRGVKRATPLQVGSAQDAVNAARQLIKDNKAAFKHRHEAAQALVSGVPASKTSSGGTVPAIPQQKTLIASVALDLEYDGHVSKRNARELHKRGLTLKDLGFPSSAQARRKSRRQQLYATGR